MKFLDTHNKKHLYIQILLYSTLLSLPFSFVRVHIQFISISITSVFAILFILTSLFFLNEHTLRDTFHTYRKEILLGIALCTTIFISALSTNTIHGWGIFGEWFFVPLSFLFFALAIAQKLQNLSEHISNALIASLSLTLATIVSATLLVLLGLIDMEIFTYDHRLHALWTSPNHLALFLVPLIFITGQRIIFSHKKYYQRFLSLLIITSFCVLLLTQSIFGILAFFFGTIILFLFYEKKDVSRRIHSSLLILFIFVGISTYIVFAQRFDSFITNIEHSSLASRIHIWDVTIELLRNKPLLGHGLGTFQDHYLAYRLYFPVYLEWAVPTPHNLYFMIWYSGGFFALVFSLLLIIIILTRHDAYNEKTYFFIVALYTILFHGLFDTPYFRTDLAYLTLSIIALILTMTKNPTEI